MIALIALDLSSYFQKSNYYNFDKHPISDGSLPHPNHGGGVLYTPFHLLFTHRRVRDRPDRTTKQQTHDPFSSGRAIHGSTQIAWLHKQSTQRPGNHYCLPMALWSPPGQTWCPGHVMDTWEKWNCVIVLQGYGEACSIACCITNMVGGCIGNCGDQWICGFILAMFFELYLVIAAVHSHKL